MMVSFLTTSVVMAQYTPLGGASERVSNAAGHYQPHLQITTSRDEKGRIITTVGRQWLVRQAAAPAETRYLGSPFLEFPVWQPGTLVFQNQRELPVELAYNTGNGQVSYRLPGDTLFVTGRPDTFTVKGRLFVYVTRPMGGDYYEVLHDGPIRLLKHHVTKLYDRTIQGGAYNGPQEFQAYYQRLTSYYVQEGTERPRFVTLTKAGFLRKFPDQRNQLAPLMPVDKLTEAEAIQIVSKYNQLSMTSY